MMLQFDITILQAGANQSQNGMGWMSLKRRHPALTTIPRHSLTRNNKSRLTLTPKSLTTFL